MATIPGASRFLNASTLANSRGLAAQQSNVLGEAVSGISILDVGRANVPRGAPGLSASARALNKQQIGNSSEINALFSLAGGGSATVDAARIQILGLRAGLPSSAIQEDLRDVVLNAEGEVVSDTPAIDDGSVAASENGQEVDTEA